MNAQTLILFIAGLGLLIVGAELLVRGASRLAALLGISPLAIGLTVVAFGTGAPELAVSVRSALAGQPDIAMGNVVGSNILNVLFILGLSALFTPLVVAKQLVRRDVPIMLVVSVLVFVCGLGGRISRVEGVLFVLGLIAYTVVKLRRAPVATVDPHAADLPTRAKPVVIALNAVFIVAGLVLLVIGARWLVDGAVTFAESMGASKLVIGLTIVAGGTSLPEVATSVMAGIRGHRDLAIGNVIGSNIFNILGALGLTAALSSHGVAVSEAALRFDIPVMIAVALVCLPIFFTGARVDRWEGALLLAYYVAYVAFLVLHAGDHDAVHAFERVILFLAIPLTVVVLVVGVWRQRGRDQRGPKSV